MTNDFEMAPCGPSPVLSVQMFWGPRALMLAVLEDAVRCLEEGRRRSNYRARRLAVEAEAWVRSGRRKWPFSFVNICEVLGFDVDAMRAHLLADSDASCMRPERGKAHDAS